MSYGIYNEEVEGNVDWNFAFQYGEPTILLPYTDLTGTFSAGDVVTGDESGASGTFVSVANSRLRLENVDLDFKLDEGLTGSVSGATATAGTQIDGPLKGFNLTGYEIEMQVRDKVGGSLILDISTTGGEITFVDATVGKCAILVPEATIQAIDPKTYLYDLKATDGSGNSLPILKGTWSVNEFITT